VVQFRDRLSECLYRFFALSSRSETVGHDKLYAVFFFGPSEQRIPMLVLHAHQCWGIILRITAISEVLRATHSMVSVSRYRIKSSRTPVLIFTSDIPSIALDARDVYCQYRTYIAHQWQSMLLQNLILILPLIRYEQCQYLSLSWDEETCSPWSLEITLVEIDKEAPC
jgi:hypothetical protein